MALSTYSDLVATVRSYLVGHSITDADIAGFIALAEADMGRNLRLRQGVVRAKVPVVDGRATLPADFVEAQQITLQSVSLPAAPSVSVYAGLVTIRPGKALSTATPEVSVYSAPVTILPGEAFSIPAVTAGPVLTLDAVTLDHASSARSMLRSVPTYYTVVGRSIDIVPAPAADLDTSVEITYYSRPASLSSTVATNWLLELSSDLYLYATLAAAAHWIADPQRSALWRAEAMRIMAELDVDTTRATVGNGPLIMRSRRRF